MHAIGSKRLHGKYTNSRAECVRRCRRAKSLVFDIGIQPIVLDYVIMILIIWESLWRRYHWKVLFVCLVQSGEKNRCTTTPPLTKK
jgi:hypothetical protein